MRIQILHRTAYAYDQPVSGVLQQVRLQPIDSVLQTVEDWSIDVDGGRFEAKYRDHHGNAVGLICADDAVEALTITVKGVVETHDKAGILGSVYGRAPLWYFAQSTELTKAGPLISDIAAGIDRQQSELDQFHALSAAILDRVPYALEETHAGTSAEEAVAQGLGVCQDHANIFVSAARKLGKPARYVSGYLVLDDRVEQDASHAWAEVHLDGLGWVGFDVSNGISPDERYVRLAIGRDAYDASPVSGLHQGAGTESLSVSLQVQQ